MNEPQRPSAREAFNKAADAMEAWRQQQIDALSDMQRRLFDEARRKSEEKEKAKAKELAGRRQSDIQERTRKKILEAPRLELNFGGKRAKITEVLANRLIAEYFQPGWTENLTQFHMAVGQAARTATREIEHEHEREQEAVRDQERGKRDELLRNFERAREIQPDNRQDFARAAAAGQAKMGFQQAAKGDGILQDPLKSEAIARAIAKVKEKEDEERARGDRDQGREHGKK